MEREIETGIPVACVPSAIPSSERGSHFALARELFINLALERRELPDGYAFRFHARELEAVGRFVANERKCCPFMTFEISVASAPGPLWLRMTGPMGTREVLQAELGFKQACGCT